MPEIGTSGLMSGDGKRGDEPKAQATAPILDSTWLFSNSGPVVKLSMNILAGSRVLSAVGTRPPHDGVR